jgi:1-deoxy-D-xylulose-5-phosphate synthase
MVVMAPKDEDELRHMLKTALEYPGPIALRYPRGSGAGVPMEEESQTLPIGKAEILSSGNDILILAIGATVLPAVEAAKTLEARGIAATVVNCRFVKPLDTELITRLAKEIPQILTVEENVLHGGFGAAVLECLSDAGSRANRVVRLGIPDTFVEHGSQNILRAKYGLDASGIAEAVTQMLNTNSLRDIGLRIV